jgi:protein SCO1
MNLKPLKTENGQPTARRNLLLAASSLALGAAAFAWPRLASAATLPASATSFFNNFKDMRLLDQEGKRLDLRRYTGRMVLVNFVFTGCSTICPVQTRALAEMQGQLSPQVRARLRLLSVSLDPLNDTPAALKQFVQRHKLDLSTWTFATGRPEDIDRLAEALKLFRPVPDARKPDDHSTALWLIDPQGQLRMRYSGNPPETARLVREITTLVSLVDPRKPNP